MRAGAGMADWQRAAGLRSARPTPRQAACARLLGCQRPTRLVWCRVRLLCPAGSASQLAGACTALHCAVSCIGSCQAQRATCSPLIAQSCGRRYYWSAQLAGRADSALASWITAYFNLLGQIGLTSVIAYVRPSLGRWPCTTEGGKGRGRERERERGGGGWSLQWSMHPAGSSRPACPWALGMHWGAGHAPQASLSKIPRGRRARCSAGRHPQRACRLRGVLESLACGSGPLPKAQGPWPKPRGFCARHQSTQLTQLPGHATPCKAAGRGSC